MTALIHWGTTTLVAATVLMLAVLVVRGPVRRRLGPRLAYLLWLVPAVRMILPALPARLAPVFAPGGGTSLLFAGPAGVAAAPRAMDIGTLVATLWLAGAVSLFVVYAVRHVIVCRSLLASGTEIGRDGTIRIIATDVDGPLAFGIVDRIIAVPRTFAADYSPAERALALAHEAAHHARGDLLANWGSLVVLAAHWWNPVAWLALRAFRDDQEFAADAHVLARAGPVAVPDYARVLAKAAGFGAPPACNLNARANLKGRLMMIRQTSRSTGQLAVGAAALAILGGTALAATAAAPAGTQAVTIGVKPDGTGSYALIVGKETVAAGTPLPGGRTLPAGFAPADCNLKATAKPMAMVIKGFGATRTYTVMCASAASAPVTASLTEGLASLKTMRASVATQRASKVFPEAERTHALGAIDRSIHEVTATLGG